MHLAAVKYQILIGFETIAKDYSNFMIKIPEVVLLSQSVKGYQSPLLGSTPFLKIPHPPTLLVNWSSQVFLIKRDTTVKLSSINTIRVKQQHSIGVSIFKFMLKYMLGNAYVNKIHARQCLYIVSSFCRGFPHPFNFFVVSKGILHVQLF